MSSPLTSFYYCVLVSWWQQGRVTGRWIQEFNYDMRVQPPYGSEIGRIFFLQIHIGTMVSDDWSRCTTGKRNKLHLLIEPIAPSMYIPFPLWHSIQSHSMFPTKAQSTSFPGQILMDHTVKGWPKPCKWNSFEVAFKFEIWFRAPGVMWYGNSELMIMPWCQRESKSKVTLVYIHNSSWICDNEQRS